jgi:hypothetical protein
VLSRSSFIVIMAVSAGSDWLLRAHDIDCDAWIGCVRARAVLGFVPQVRSCSHSGNETGYKT